MNLTYKQFTIRDWQKRDREAAAAVIKQVLAEYGLPWQPQLADRDVVEVESAYLETGGEFWVIEATEEKENITKIVGTAAYYPVANDPSGVEIRKMYLLPEVRGQGLGSYLLEKLELAIAEKGFATIYIETASILKEAVILYEKNHYLPMSEVNTARCDLSYYKRLQ